jgi:hypothetical protein
MDVFALQRNLSGHVLYGKVHGERTYRTSAVTQNRPMMVT